MKADEAELLRTMQKATREHMEYTVPVIKIISDATINDKRAYYILKKWTDKGLYEYGVSIAYGWLTDEGINYKID
jgi:hypothetical protein